MKSRFLSASVRINSALLLLLLSSIVFAWKPKTHLYLAEQALKDAITDDSVTIFRSNDSILGKFAVSVPILTTIKLNPAQYRAGAIGPDAYPDILTGQMLIHPREPGTWKWLNYLWSQTSNDATASRAFVSGYFAHAAGDLFGHTFINHFAGGPWVLGENAVKHIVLESYLDNHMPPTVKATGSTIGESDISIGSGVDRFIAEKMVDAKPGSMLDMVLLSGSSGNLSIPRIYSSLRNYLQGNVDGYNQQLRSFDREYDEYIKDAKNCGWFDFTCSKTISYLKAAAVQTEKLAWQATAGVVIKYEEAWRDDITDGLALWPSVSHEVALALFAGDSADVDRAKKVCNDYAINHLISMSGAPDGVGVIMSAISDVMDALFPKFVVDAIDAVKKELLNFLLQHTLGFTTDDVKDYFKDPALHFEKLGLELSGYKRDELHFTASDTVIKYQNVAATFNTVNMIKLTMLDTNEFKRLLKMVPADSGMHLSAANVMLGGWFQSLDESRQWTNGRDKSLRMVLAEDTAVFYQLFKHQAGENDDFASPYPQDTTIVDSRPLDLNVMRAGYLDSRKNKTEAWHKVSIPRDGKLIVDAGPINPSLHPFRLALYTLDYEVIDNDENYEPIAHVEGKNLRAGAYLIYIAGEIGNVCDDEIYYPPGYWPADTGCNRWGGFGKYWVTPKLVPQQVKDIEPDDSVPAAVAIGMDTLVRRTLGYSDSYTWDIGDYTKIKLDTPGDLAVWFSPDSTLKADISLFDSDGYIYTNASAVNSRTKLYAPGLDSGTYYVSVEVSGNYVYGAYSLIAHSKSLYKADKEPNNSDTSCTSELVKYNIIEGTLDSKDLYDYYIVPVASDGSFSVGVFADSGMMVEVQLYSAEGKVIKTVDSTYRSRTRISVPSLAAGDYRIKVIRKAGSGRYAMVAEGDYLSVNAVERNMNNNYLSKMSLTLKPLGNTLAYQYSVARTGSGSLNIFDAQGRMVQKIIQGHMVGGYLYKGQFDTGILRNGWYCAVLKSSGGIQTKTLFIVH